MKQKVKINWDLHETAFLRQSFPDLTWSQLLIEINAMRDEDDQIELGSLRHQCRRMGLKKFDLVHWDKRDVNFLKKNFKTMGNIEIAKALTEKKRSSRVIDGVRVYRKFTQKHIEKKIKLLSLHRSDEDLKTIRIHNMELGMGYRFTSEKNAWSLGVRLAAQEEEVRIWKDQTGKKKRMVKVNGKFIPYTAWFYRNFIGPVPSGHIVYHLDTDSLNDDPDNLATCLRTGLNSTDRLTNAISLLINREKKLLESLPSMNYDKNREEIRRMHSDLNRIRKIRAEIEVKIKKRTSIIPRKTEIKYERRCRLQNNQLPWLGIVTAN